MFPTYEITFLIKPVPKEELAKIIKRSAQFVFNRSGFLRDLKYLGLQNTPYRMSKNGNPYWKANYVYFEANLPKAEIRSLFDEFIRDVDVIRHTFYLKSDEAIDYESCTFEEEMKPVPYRPQVQKLIELSKNYQDKKHRRRVKLNMCADYYPFRK